MTTKILALTDAPGNLVRFVPLPGQRHGVVGVAPLIDGIEFDGLSGEGVRRQLAGDRRERARRQGGDPTPTPPQGGHQL